MMKKILMMAILCLVFTTSGFAQFKRTAFNHVGLNAGVGTEGISIGVAAPISNFVELEAGVDILPKFLSISDKANITTDASIIVQGQTVRIPDSKVDIDADFSRTAFHAKANIYPFGGNSKFFVAAGFAFGGAVRFLAGGCGLGGCSVRLRGRFAAGGEDGVLHLAVCHHGRLGGSGRRR